MAWTDESKAKAISMYKEAEPTPENSLEIVKEIADDLDESVNGVRMILIKAGVYVKKDTAAPAAGGSSEKKAAGGGRVSKEASQATLKAAIEDAGATVDEEIISKLTGKAAVYFAGVFASLKSGD